MKNKEILKNYLYWTIAFLGCMLIGIIRTYAITFTDFIDVHTNTQVLVEYSTGSSPVNWPYNNSTLYQNDMRKVNFIIDNYTFQANTHYEFESHMLGKYFKGQPIYSVTPNNSSATCITDSYYLNFINGEYPRWDFQCNQNVSSVTITIYNSNNSVIMDSGYFGWGSAIVSKSSTPINSTNNDTDIIINNNNYNTNQIIDNSNQNTQDIIDSNKVCEIIDKSYIELDNKQLTSSGGELNNNQSGVTKYINIENATIEELTYNVEGYLNRFCFYDANKTYISCEDNARINDITIPNNATYFRSTIVKSSNKPTYKICRNGNQANNDAINNLNDTLNSDDVDDNGIADAFEDFNDYLDDNSTITRLLTLPITLFTAILNNVNGTCQPFNLGALYGENLTLPCIDVSQYLGNTLWTMIDVIISGFAIYAISKKMIKIFNNFSSLKEGDVIDD